jgi:nitronate monooxygenase
MTAHNRLLYQRVERFCRNYDLQLPILMAPMAGASPPALASAVANAGGLGACGALLLSPESICEWAGKFRSSSGGGYQVNLWIPGPVPPRDTAAEAAMREFLASWSPDLSAAAKETAMPDFAAQFETILALQPQVISSIMGLYPDHYVSRLKEAGIRWFATVTTVAEAKAAEAAGADALIAQGMEAGGHRGTFSADDAATNLVGLFSLLPAVCDAVSVPVIAAGGIADGRGIAAALTLGASAVQIGTGFLRCPEAQIPAAWSQAIGSADPEDTIVTRAFSGRPGRAIRNAYLKAVDGGRSPLIPPYPIQGMLTRQLREKALTTNDFDCMQAWAGQSARLARADTASEVVTSLWQDASRIMVGHFDFDAER